MVLKAGALHDAWPAAETPADKGRAAAEELVARSGAITGLKRETALLKTMSGIAALLRLGTPGTIVAVATNHLSFR